jgi:hypothetical protein
MRRTFTKEFDGHTWELTEHPATEGQAIILSIGHLIGTAIEAATNAGIRADSDIAVDGKLIATLARDVLGNVDPGKIGDLVKLLVKYVKKDGQPVGGPAFDDAFAGDYMTLYQCAGWVIMENFRTVFRSTGIAEALSAIPGTMKQALGRASKPSSDPTTQSGSSASGPSGG